MLESEKAIVCSRVWRSRIYYVIDEDAFRIGCREGNGSEEKPSNLIAELPN